MGQFGEHHRGPTPVPPTVAFCVRAALCDGKEAIEQEPLEGEREDHEYTEEVDSLVSSLWSSTDNDRHTGEADPPESSPQNNTDSNRQTEEDEAELSVEPTGKPTDGPTDETAVKLIEGHPPNDELTKDHPPDNELTETITVEYPPPGQELPLEGSRRRTG